MSDTYQFGMLGVGVMGRNLAWNIADHGYTVSVWNRELDMLDDVLAQHPGKLHGTRTLEEFVASLERPRRIMLMITAGKPVDMVIDALEPLLEPGDIVIDGGNSWFEDTQRREARLTAKGMNFFGVGVSAVAVMTTASAVSVASTMVGVSASSAPDASATMVSGRATGTVASGPAWATSSTGAAGSGARAA